jgi:CBS domain-containing protein
MRRGQRLRASFAIEQGSIELATRRGTDWEIEAEFAAGSLLGEATLAASDGDEAILRAREATEVLTVDDAALAQMSSVLRPLQALIQRSVSLPRRSIWRHHRGAMFALEGHRAGQLANTDAIVCDESEPLGGAFLRLIEARKPCILGTRDTRLCGIASRSDLLAALARGCDRASPLGEALNRRYFAVDTDTRATAAAELMAEHGLTSLPVVDMNGAPFGLIDADDIVRWALTLPR